MKLFKSLLQSSPYLTRLGRRVQLRYFPGQLEPEINLLPFLVDRTRTAIDIGGNVGVYTNALLALARKVIVVEANPELARSLGRIFGDRITLVNAAASSEDGEAVLRIPDVGSVSAGLATVAAENDLDGSGFREVTVPALRIASVVDADEPVGFIKIDVEGHELAVLQGCLPIIARHRPTILVEAEERHRTAAVASIVDLLEPFGYAGFMLRDGVLCAIEGFGVDAHQGLTPAQSLAISLGDRPDFYINNFVFIPRPGPLP